MGESNTVVSAYTTYRHLQQYYSHPSIFVIVENMLNLGVVPSFVEEIKVSKNNQIARAAFIPKLTTYSFMICNCCLPRWDGQGGGYLYSL